MSEIESAEGKDVIINFDGKRCIHARFCVLQQPGVFKANVVGPWIAPDDATTTEGLIAVAQACPSGAITYKRKDGGPEEAAPPVNLVQLREDGPLAFRARSALMAWRSVIAPPSVAAASRRTSPIATAHIRTQALTPRASRQPAM